MSAVSLDFRNIIGSRKCAIPSPEIVSLEIGDESPGDTNDSAFSTFFLSDYGSENGITNHDDNTSGRENQVDKDFLIHSQLTLSTCSPDNRYSNQESRSSDCNIDDDLLELLNSAKSTKTVEPTARKFLDKNISTCANDKMKTWNNLQVSGDNSELISSLLLTEAVPAKNGFYKLPSLFCDAKTDIGDFDILTLNINGHNPEKSIDKDHKLSQVSALKDQSCLSNLLSSVNIQNSNKDAFTKSNLNEGHCANSSKFNAGDSLSDLLSSITVENTDADKSITSRYSGEFRGKSSNNTKFKIEGSLSDLLLPINTENSIRNKPDNNNEQNLRSSSFETEGSFFDLLSLDSNETKSAKSKLLIQPSSNSTMKGESSLYDLLSANAVDLNVSKTNMFNPRVKSPTGRVEDCVSDWLSTVNVENSNAFPSNALNKLTLTTTDVKSSHKFFSGSPDLDIDSTSEATDSSSNDSCASSFSDVENNSLKGSLTKDGVLMDSDDSGFNSFDSQKKGFSFFSSAPESLIPFNSLLSERPNRSKNVNKHNGTVEKGMSMLDVVSTINLGCKNPVSNKVKICALSHSGDTLGTDEGYVSMVELMKSINSHGSLSENLSNPSTDFARTGYDTTAATRSSETTISIPKESTPHSEGDFFSDEDKSVRDTEVQFIDLSSCLKSTESKLNSTLPSREPENSLIRASPSSVKNYILDEKLPLYIPQNHLNPFECCNIDLVKKSRVNTKQSLFAKALACKPRKNPSLTEKVVSIKCELIEKIINRPVLVGCDVPPPKTEVVSYSDRCILPFEGLKYFGVDAPSEPQ